MNVSVSALAVCLSLVLGTAYAEPDKSAGEPPKKSKQSKQAKQKGSASAGRSAPSGPPAFVPDPAYQASYAQADIDGDGEVSKAEAAGNETLVVGFDRADRNRDGKLSRKEYEALFRAKDKAVALAREREQKALARAKLKAEQASAGNSARASR